MTLSPITRRTSVQTTNSWLHYYYNAHTHSLINAHIQKMDSTQGTHSTRPNQQTLIKCHKTSKPHHNSISSSTKFNIVCVVLSDGVDFSHILLLCVVDDACSVGALRSWLRVIALSLNSTPCWRHCPCTAFTALLFSLSFLFDVIVAWIWRVRWDSLASRGSGFGGEDYWGFIFLWWLKILSRTCEIISIWSYLECNPTNAVTHFIDRRYFWYVNEFVETCSICKQSEMGKMSVLGGGHF